MPLRGTGAGGGRSSRKKRDVRNVRKSRQEKGPGMSGVASDGRLYVINASRSARGKFVTVSSARLARVDHRGP